MDTRKYSQNKYGIIIASHQPKLELLFDILVKLSRMDINRIFLIDSSNLETSRNLQLFIDKLNEASKIQNIYYKNVENCGVGHKYNLGFELCLKHNCDVMTILTDDVIIDEKKFKPMEIVNYFYTNLDVCKDVLALSSWNRENFGIRSEIELGPDFGMTLSNKLAQILNFREDLVLDFSDVDLCLRIRKNGGKIKLYTRETITSIPSGSKTSEDVPHLPVWRIYLDIRNYLALSYEYKDLKFFMINSYCVVKFFITSYMCGEKFSHLFKAAFLGLLDSISGKLGITDNLQNLTNNIFYNGKTRIKP